MLSQSHPRPPLSPLKGLGWTKGGVRTYWTFRSYCNERSWIKSYKMSAGLFRKAIKNAGFSVTTSRDGGRSFRGRF